MTVIRRAECPTCGRLRNPDLTTDHGAVCRGPWALNEHEPTEWVVVEYVPAEQLRGAVSPSADDLRRIREAVEWASGCGYSADRALEALDRLGRQ